MDDQPFDNPAESSKGLSNASEERSEPFDKLAEQAASGLKGDQELYLDVKQELRSHLEEKAEKFAREGHTEDESADLAKKSFGSPLDVAADLLNANKRRMKLRALFRLAFGALIVPVAILLALYVGYWGFSRVSSMYYVLSGGDVSFPYRYLSFFGIEPVPNKENAEALGQLESGKPELLRAYWMAHRHEPDSRIYYAYYALSLGNRTENESLYAAAMREGERIDPQNALYNVLLAELYLRRGMQPRTEEKPKPPPPGMPGPYPPMITNDRLLDRRTSDLGILELRKAVSKPYLRCYQAEIMHKKLSLLPNPRLTEGYFSRLLVAYSEVSIQYGLFRDLARRVPACARLLLAEGRSAEAEAVMDMWKPYTRLLFTEQSGSEVQPIVTAEIGLILTRQAPEVYECLRKPGKSREAKNTRTRLRSVVTEHKRASAESRERLDTVLSTHGSFLGMHPFLYSDAKNMDEASLTPGRMHEHVLAEEAFVQVLLFVLTAALVGSLISGFIWFRRMRGAASVPLLLVLPASDILRALLLGTLLPMLVYWVYSRMPVIGGREYSLWVIWPRMLAEGCILGLVMFWVPAGMVRKAIRRRCADLEVPVPSVRQEIGSSWKSTGRLILAAALLAMAIQVDCSYEFDAYLASPYLSVLAGLFLIVAAMLCMVYAAAKQRGAMGLGLGGILLAAAALLVYSGASVDYISPSYYQMALWLGCGALAIWMGVSAVVYVARGRDQYGLYLGTVARSIAPVYALAILFIALTIQPWLVWNETIWLREDKVGLGYVARAAAEPMARSSHEAQASGTYTAAIRKALEGK